MALLSHGPESVTMPDFGVGWWAQHEQQMLGKDEDDDSDDDDDDDDIDDDDDDDDEDADKSDDELRAELKTTRDALKKASNQSAKRRKALRTKEAELEAERKKRTEKPTPKGGDSDKPEPVDVEAIREEVRREARKESDERTKKSEVRGALRAAGVPADKIGSLVKVADLEDLDVDDDGNVDGIDDVLEALKAEYPERFPKIRKKRGSVAGDGDRNGDDEGKGGKKLTTDELQARVAMGRNRR